MLPLKLTSRCPATPCFFCRFSLHPPHFSLSRFPSLYLLPPFASLLPPHLLPLPRGTGHALTLRSEWSTPMARWVPKHKATPKLNAWQASVLRFRARVPFFPRSRPLPLSLRPPVGPSVPLSVPPCTLAPFASLPRALLLCLPFTHPSDLSLSIGGRSTRWRRRKTRWTRTTARPASWWCSTSLLWNPSSRRALFTRCEGNGRVALPASRHVCY